MREDWEEGSLGLACKIGSSKRILKKEYVSNGIPFYRTKEVKELSEGKDISIELFISSEKYNEIKERFDIPKAGDILISAVGTIGVSYIVKDEKPFYFKDGNLLWLRNIVGLEPKFLSLGLTHFIRNKKTLDTSGTAYNALTIEKLNTLNFPFSPLSEQRAIVAKIEELFSDLDKGIADLKKAQDQLKVYRQAVLKKAFEGELTKEWREQQTDLPSADELLEQIKEERQKHYEQQLENWKEAVKGWEENGKEGKKPGKPKLLKDPDKIEDGELENYSNLPDSWLWSRLANTVVDHSSDIVDGPFGSNLKSTEYQDEGKPILRIQNIKSNQFINKNIKFVTEEKYHFLKRHQFKPNDVIVTKLGDPLGLACRVPLDFTSGVIVADLIRIRPSSKHINYDWLTLLINSIVIQSQFRRITKGTTRPRMNLTIMRNTIVPLPAYEEQHQIVQEIESRLSVCDKVEESISESLDKAKALRQSILKKAFEGTLLSEEEIAACKAAPDYEPASVLLEKIKAEKKK